MEQKKNPSANLEKFKFLFLIISFIISLGVVFYVFNVESRAADKQAFSLNQTVEEEEMMEVTRQDIEPPKPEPERVEQQQVVEEIILKENDDVITENWEVDNSFNEDDAVNLEETGMGEVEETIFVYAEHMPEPPGGINGLRSFISKNINYPVVAQENGIQGTVYLRFEVTKSGKVGKVEIQKGADPLLNDEAVRVIKTLPDFKPGSQNGKPVNVWFSIPVVFKLAQ